MSLSLHGKQTANVRFPPVADVQRARVRPASNFAEGSLLIADVREAGAEGALPGERQIDAAGHALRHRAAAGDWEGGEAAAVPEYL